MASQVVGAGGVSHGALADLLAENGVDVLICGGLGGGAQGPADDAVAAYLAGSMRQTDEASCGGHGHHGHEGGCGHHEGVCGHGGCEH